MKKDFNVLISIVVFIFLFAASIICLKPAFAANEPHRFPCLFWDDNSGPVNVSMAYKDNTSTWQVNADIVTDADANQFVNQHNRLVYMTDGEYGIVLIEDTSKDLELWQEGTPGWSADGTFTVTADDTTNDNDFVDVRSKQNGFHGIAVETNALMTDYAFSIFPDGAGVFVLYGGVAFTFISSDFSIVHDRTLAAWIDGVVPDGNFSVSHDYNNLISTGAFAFAGTGAMLINDGSDKLWLFNIESPDLKVYIFDNIYSIILEDALALNPITETIIDLTGPNEQLLNYKASVRYLDNTLHVVSLEKIQNFPNWDYKLTYYRRDHNGWSDAMVVDTWSIAIAAIPDIAAQDARQSVQITVDNAGNILLFNVEWDVVNSRGDLQVWELDFSDYDDYTTGGNWSQTTNLDSSTRDVLDCSALNIHP